MTWRRLAPAARRRPTSRNRSETVIDSVLKIRNAPANRATAAMRPVVAWKSAVDARSEAARSCGEDSTYGSVTRRVSSAAETAAASAPGARPMSTLLTPVSPKTACAVRSGTTTVRPNAPVSGPSPAMMPMTR